MSLWRPYGGTNKTLQNLFFVVVFVAKNDSSLVGIANLYRYDVRLPFHHIRVDERYFVFRCPFVVVVVVAGIVDVHLLQGY